MSFDKGTEAIMTIGTLAALSTVPASPGGTECTQIDMDVSCQLALTLEGTFSVAGTITAHMRTSPTGGATASVWDTQDYTEFDLIASAGSREQITKGIWCDPLYACVQVVNPGTEAVNDVIVTRTTQDMEAT